MSADEHSDSEFYYPDQEHETEERNASRHFDKVE